MATSSHLLPDCVGLGRRTSSDCERAFGRPVHPAKIRTAWNDNLQEVMNAEDLELMA
jgi:hypothetical protein